MKDVIEEIIRTKQHLAEPLRFYEKASRFFEAVGKMPLTGSLAKNAYEPKMLNEIFDRFAAFLALPEGTLSPLQHAMELEEIDFTRLPLGEAPAFSLPYPEDDLVMMLFLISKPYFFSIGKARDFNGRTWEEGKCPVCQGRPAVSWIGEDGRRQVSCSYCGTTGFVLRSGCPLCQRIDSEKQKILIFESESDFMINTCDLCSSYFKTVDAGVISRYSIELADMMSLPLDIVVQEKGHSRRSPNPIGMRKMTSRG